MKAVVDFGLVDHNHHAVPREKKKKKKKIMRPRRGKARGQKLRAAQDLARRHRRQTILASAAAVIILALGGAATWMFRDLAATRESQVAQLEYENSVLSRLLRQEFRCASMVRKCLRHARKWSRKAGEITWAIAPGMSASQSR